MTQNRAIQAINGLAASNSTSYISTDFGIEKTNEETRNIISSTFGAIKNNLDLLWDAVGLDPNVTNSYQQIMSDPNSALDFNGRTYRPHPGVGNLHPYNEMGNPAGGCFSFYTMG